MQFTVLASGSKGNSALLATSSTRILVDAGLSGRELFRRMSLAGHDPAILDAIVITHEHSDHVQGMAAIARKLGIPVYLTEGTHREWERLMRPRMRQTYAQWAEAYRARKAADSAACAAMTEEGVIEALEAMAAGPPGIQAPLPTEPIEDESRPDPARLPEVRYVRAGERFALGDIEVHPFTIPHDAADPVGYVFCAEGARLAVATDLGYMPPNVVAQLQDCDLLMLESNHDLEMLRDGPYPWSVKQRVLSRVGHLSNDAAAEFLEQSWDGKAGYVILAHLSESNNLPELARLAAERALASHGAGLSERRLLLARQEEALETVSF